MKRALAIALSASFGCASTSSSESAPASDAGVAIETGHPCGHDCLGGACVSNVCQPVDLAVREKEQGGAIAVNATNVVYSDGDDLVVRDKVSGEEKRLPLQYGALYPPVDLAIDDTAVYVARSGSGSGYNGRVERHPLDGSPKTDFPLPSPTPADTYSPNAIGLSGDQVLWTWSVASGATGGALIRAPKSGASRRTLSPYVPWFAADDRGVFWPENDSAKVFTLEGDVPKALFDGGWGTKPDDVKAFVLASDGIYWADWKYDATPPSGTLARVSLASGKVDRLHTFTAEPDALLVSEKHVFFRTRPKKVGGEYESSIVRVSKGGGAPETLITERAIPDFALDGEVLYWLEPRKVRRLAR